MSIFANDNIRNLEFEERKPLPICPAENLQAVVRGIFDIGYEIYNDKANEKVLVVFEIDEPTPQSAGEYAGKRFNLNKRFTKKISKDLSGEKITDLTKLILACTGLDTIPSDFKLSDLVGLNCQIDVKHAISAKGNKYAKINNISKKIKGLPLLEIEKPYDSVPDWITRVMDENKVNKPKLKTDDESLIETMPPEEPFWKNEQVEMPLS